MGDLGTLAGGTSAAYGINDGGQVVGESDGRAFLFDGVMRDLGSLGGSSSVATAINNAGQVVGYSTTAGGATHAFLLQGDQMTDIGTLGGSWSRAYAINRWGQVIGISATAGDADVHVFSYGDGAIQDIETLLPPGTSFSKDNWIGREKAPGLGLNDLGTIVGAAPCTPTEFCVSAQHAYKLTDTVAAVCEAGSTGVTGGGTKYVRVVVQDRGSGLRGIHVLQSANANVEIAPFQVATPKEEVVTLTQRKTGVPFGARLDVADVAGNVATCAFSQKA